VNACRQRPSQQRHSSLFRRSIRLAVIIPSAASHQILPGILSALRSGYHMI
jgi:hypothetical protein